MVGGRRDVAGPGRPGDLVLTLGAGDVTMLGERCSRRCLDGAGRGDLRGHPLSGRGRRSRPLEPHRRPRDARRGRRRMAARQACRPGGSTDGAGTRRTASAGQRRSTSSRSTRPTSPRCGRVSPDRRDRRYALVVGHGTNLLVADTGFPGVVVGSAADSPGCAARRRWSRRGRDAILALIAWAASEGLAGMAFAVGIPGTVGGAVRMNAGAHGGEWSACSSRSTSSGRAAAPARSGRTGSGSATADRLCRRRIVVTDGRLRLARAIRPRSGPGWTRSGRGGGPRSRCRSATAAGCSRTRRATPPDG